MRKFKTNNRPKRKYVRRDVPSPHFYLSKSTAIGLIPSLLICIGFLITFLINSHQLSRSPSIQIHFRAPLFSLDGVSRFINGIIPALYAFVQSSVQYTITQTGDLYRNFLHLLAFIDPRPFFLTTSRDLISSTQGILKQADIGFSGLTIKTSIAIHELIRLSGVAIITVIHFLIFVFQFLQNVVLQCTKAVAFVFEAVSGWIVAVIHWAVTGIQNLIHVLLAPFRLIGEYMDKQKPFIHFVSSSFEQSAGSLNTSFKDLINLSSEMAKASH